MLKLCAFRSNYLIKNVNSRWFQSKLLFWYQHRTYTHHHRQLFLLYYLYFFTNCNAADLSIFYLITVQILIPKYAKVVGNVLLYQNNFVYKILRSSLHDWRVEIHHVPFPESTNTKVLIHKWCNDWLYQLHFENWYYYCCSSELPAYFPRGLIHTPLLNKYGSSNIVKSS